MCAPHPIDPAHLLAPIETAVPPEEEATTEHTEHTEDALAALAEEMHEKCVELFGGARLGQWAAAMLIDSYADRIERALGIQPVPKVAGAPDGNALDACGYRVEEDAPAGRFAFTLETPYEGATIRAGMAPRGDSGRFWAATVRVLNCRGQGWYVRAVFEDCGRHVAKSLLRHLALEMRRLYCHRNQKVRQRAIARAIARRGAEEAARA